MKINLKQVIYNIRGMPVKVPKLDENNQPIIEQGKQEMKTMCVRDYFLIMLGSKFEMQDKSREPFWTTDLGIACAKQDVLEIKGEQLEFLKRIIETNKVKQILPMGGEKEIAIFFPYEIGQLLKILEKE